MDKLIIEGGHRLSGSVKIGGSKNAALPILFATILTDQKCSLRNVPDLVDIDTTVRLLQMMGIEVTHNRERGEVEVCAQQLSSYEASYDLVRTMRASVLVLGPTLARFGKARVSLPGGCTIGARPVNLHLTALEKMGAQISIEQGYIQAEIPHGARLHGAEIAFDQVSVGATENTVMAATLADGTTILRNAAQEPEIVDLVQFLRAMGAQIEGEGTPTITIHGGAPLKAVTHSIIPDRIEAGTYLIAAAITGGEVSLPGVPQNILAAVIDKLIDCGLDVRSDANGIYLKSSGKLQAADISTVPFPGFPTDMQAQFMALMAVSTGTSVINENIFENRFMHVPELARLGANITIQGRTAVVRGAPGGLTGATVMATDLRASASLVLAALAASGTTVIHRMYHLDRGYERMEVKLSKLGARIKRERED